MDMAHMRVEDFASQRFSSTSETAELTVYDDGSTVGGGAAAVSIVSAGGGGDTDHMARPLSKRKRKAPAQADEMQALSQVGGWVRLALA